MPCLQEALHSMTAGPVPGPSGVAEAWPRFHEEEERLADAVDGRAERLKREKGPGPPRGAVLESAVGSGPERA